MEKKVTDIIEVPVSGGNEQLHLKLFPQFAAFLLTFHLEDFVRSLVRSAHEENVPVLKYFKSYSEEELLNLALKTNREFLQLASENRLDEQIENSIRMWKGNRIKFLEPTVVIAKDIALINRIYRKGLSDFLSHYTRDFGQAFSILDEIDQFLARVVEKSIQSYLEIQRHALEGASQSLSVSQEQLLEAQELTSMGSFIWDLTGHNSSFTRQVGVLFDMSHWSSLTDFLEFVHEEDRPVLQEAFDNVLRDGGTYECVFRFVKNGMVRNIWSRGKAEFNGGIPALIKGTVMDITEKEKMIQSLRQSEDEYHKMVEEVENYAILKMDTNGNILNWNKGAEKIKGYKAEEIIGKNFRVFYTEEDRKNKIPEHLISIAVQEGKAALEGWRLRKDGTRFWGSIVITALHDDKKNVTGFTKVTRDLTERKLAEDRALEYTHNLEIKNEELRRINEELESFNYAASHDLQEPLRKVQFYSDRILEKEAASLSPSGISYLQKINNSSARMQSLILDLLAFSQNTSSSENYKVVDLNELVKEAAASIAHILEESKGRIETEHLPNVNVVSFQFRQLFINLISNAIKYRKAHEPPVIRISASVVNGSGYIEDGAFDGKMYTRITLSDNGIGFDMMHRKNIFELFRRLHRKGEYAGTGIGLTICKKILSKHNGFITADSIPGEGSRFHLFLPEERIIPS